MRNKFTYGGRNPANAGRVGRNKLPSAVFFAAKAPSLTLLLIRKFNTTFVGTGVPDCPQIELTKYGQIADKYIKQLNDFYNHLSIEEYVIMPNHIHLLLWVKENKDAIENGQSRTPVPTNIERANSACSQFVSTFKRFCNKEYGTNIWQRSFHDHIIRDKSDYEKISKYMYENPIKWQYDCFYVK